MATDYGSDAANKLFGGTTSASAPVVSSNVDYGSDAANKLFGSSVSTSLKTPTNIDELIKKTNPVDTSKLFSTLNFGGTQTTTPSIIKADPYGATKNPIVAAITGGSTFGKFLKDTTDAIPDSSKKVSDVINTPITKASDYLSNTGFIKQSAEGINAGGGGVAMQILSKLSDLSGAQVLQGATGGLYKAPDVTGGAKDDIVDTTLKGLSQGLGTFLGLKGLGAITPSLGVTQGIESLLSKYPTLSKYLTPYVGEFVKTTAALTTLGQLDPNLAGNLQARVKKLGTDIATAPLYVALGAIKNAGVSIPASFGLGYGMAKLGGANNQDALASGFAFAFMDGVGRTQGDRGFTPAEINAKLKTEAIKTLSHYGDITENSTPTEIKEIFNKAVHQSSPLVGGNSKILESVKNAYDFLTKGKGNLTEPEKNVSALRSEIKDTIDTHGIDLTHQALKDNLGLDDQTAQRLIESAQKPQTEAEIKDLNESILKDIKPTEKKKPVVLSPKNEIPKELQPLAEEAKKYKSAEELYKEGVLDPVLAERYKEYSPNGQWIEIEIDPKKSKYFGSASEQTIKEYDSALKREGLDNNFKNASKSNKPIIINKVSPNGEISVFDGLHRLAIARSDDSLIKAIIPESQLENFYNKSTSEKSKIQSPPTTIEGTGETKTRGLSQGVEEKAIANKLTESLGDLPSYETVNMKDQAKKATDILNKDYEQAKRIALGHESPPEGVIPEAVFIAVENKAIKDGDVNTLRDLATTSGLSAEATSMGQRIRTLAERNPDSPVGAIKDVSDAREKVAKKKYKDVKKAKKDVVDDIKKEIKKSTPKKQSWEEFISTITC